MAKFIDADALQERFKQLCYPVRYDYNFNSIENGMSITGIRQVIDETPAADVEPARKWIPCSERLPEVYDSYLIAWRPAHMEEMQTWKVPHFYDIVEYSPAEGWLTEEIETDYENPEILAWMPLPEPYREDEGVIDV